MKLNKITKRWIKDIAGKTIFGRGEGYFRSEMVSHIEYEPEKLCINANVSGHYGNYEVKIFEEAEEVTADCDCPYQGYPCKHIVAVLLHFIKNKKEHVANAKERKKFFDVLKKNLAQYSREKLIAFIVAAAQKYPDFKREWMFRLDPDNSSNLNALIKQVRHMILDDFEEDLLSEPEKIRELKKIIKSVEKANASVRSTILWEIADKTIAYISEYGIDDEEWENLFIQTVETIKPLVKAPELEEKRNDIIDQLQYYYDLDNCGILDYLTDSIDELSD